MKKLLLISLISMPVFSKNPIIIGHRGASGYEPENTLRSFDRAIKMGVQMIELDVFMTKSNEIVVIHDDTIDRTTNGSARVDELSWQQLKKFDAGKGEHIPLLSQVFDLVDKRIIINIEIKDSKATLFVGELINRYINEKNWPSDKFLVTSFDADIINKFHKNFPKINIGVIFEDNFNNPIDIVSKVHAKYLITDYHVISGALINRAHKENLKVFAYTVNNKDVAKKLFNLNIDGIITNFPDILD